MYVSRSIFVRFCSGNVSPSPSILTYPREIFDQTTPLTGCGIKRIFLRDCRILDLFWRDWTSPVRAPIKSDIFCTYNENIIIINTVDEKITVHATCFHFSVFLPQRNINEHIDEKLFFLSFSWKHNRHNTQYITHKTHDTQHITYYQRAKLSLHKHKHLS